jgi:hypothetical protein
MFSLFLIILGGLSAIQVSGNQSGTWESANNPYQVIGNVTVPAGEVLTIQSGVVVEIMGAFQITIAGNMHAEGTESDSIRFVNMQTPVTTLWPGLRFENESFSSTLNHVYIEYATYGIRCMNSPLTVTNSRINRCQKGMELYGIGVSNPANVLVDRCIVENCIQNGILISQNSNAVISYNEIRGNGTGTQFYAAIQLSNQSTNGSNNPHIEHNNIHHNLKQGISAWDLVGANAINPQILNNMIKYNYTGVYFLNASGYIADNEICHNFIPGDMNSGAGVMVSGATSEPYFERNLISGNYTGFYITNNARPVLGDMSIYHSWAQGENIISGNIDANGDLHSIFCAQYPNAANIIKAENNLWGVNTAEEVALGIQDSNDVSTLPTVDFDPFIINVIPTSIVGSYQELVPMTLSNVKLDLIAYNGGHVIQSFPLPSLQFDVTALVEEPFYAMIVAERQPGNTLVYGLAGGFMNPIQFYPSSFSPVDVGVIYITGDAPPRYEIVGQPIIEGELTLHPLMHGISVYGWFNMDLVYPNGDFLILKRNIRRTMAGEITTELPPDTVYRKYLNISPGDTWDETEVHPITGQILPSSVRVDNCKIASYIEENIMLITRHTPEGNVVDKQLLADTGNLLFRYDNHYVISKEEFSHIGAADPLAPHSGTSFLPGDIDQVPNILLYNPDLYYDNPEQPIVRLYWQAPGTQFPIWTNYRIYRNNELIATIPFSQSEYTDTSWDGTNDAFYQVVAWDELQQLESGPTNGVIVGTTANHDELLPPLNVSVSPNPVRFSQGQQLELKFNNLNNRNAEISIYNVKGQMVHTTQLHNNPSFQWNGKDKSGNRCASGIYFMKANIKGESPIIRKLVVY